MKSEKATARDMRNILEGAVMEHARQVKATGDLACAVDIAAAIGAIDVSRQARAAGDAGSAEAALDKARRLLAALIIDEDAT